MGLTLFGYRFGYALIFELRFLVVFDFSFVVSLPNRSHPITEIGAGSLPAEIRIVK
jgi:hypothetical protein